MKNEDNSFGDRIKNHDWGLSLATLGAGLLATLVTIKADLFDLETAQQAAQTERIEILYGRVDKALAQNERQRLVIAELRRALIQKEAQIMSLEIKVAAKLDSMGSLFAMLEAMKVPAWLKRYDPEAVDPDDSIIMLYANREYEYAYRVSARLYIGSSDFDIWPRAIAEEYRKNDKKVLREKTWLEFYESSQTRAAARAGKIGRDWFWKFYIHLEDDTELIAGIKVQQPARSDEACDGCEVDIKRIGQPDDG